MRELKWFWLNLWRGKGEPPYPRLIIGSMYLCGDAARFALKALSA